MQTRTCFNGGELSPELSARADLDVYMRGCQTLENWELSQMGGVKRRRGMRQFATCEPGARLIPFVYSYSGQGNRFIVVLGSRNLRVLDMQGEELASFESELDAADTHALQINALLLLTSSGKPPMALEVSSDLEWSYHEFPIDEPAWRYDNEKRDNKIEVTKKDKGCYVEFSEHEDENEADVWQQGDELRASFWTEQKEAKATTSELLDDVRLVTSLTACDVGDKVAMKGEVTKTYWICKKEFPADLFRDGLDDPENYPDNFVKADNTNAYLDAQEITSVKELGTVSLNKKFCMLSGYWEFYTCIKKFTALNIVPGATDFDDYPGYFIRGLAVGKALPCRGSWTFYCSGLWYGAYEVRKNYESTELSDEWETCGISFSRLGSGSNDNLSGDEADRECYLRLFITKSRWMDQARAQAGFPPESCSNRLIVPGYRHDMRLRFRELDADTDDPIYDYVNKVKVDWEGVRTIENWSWQAWSQRYGYPTVAAICQQRLCFAGTAAQPQTIWMSQVDDIGNFMTGDSDDSAIVKTMYSTSQNPICWMYENRNCLLCGTAEAEWAIGNSNAALTPSSCPMTRHNATGSENGELALQVETVVLFIERGSGRCFACGYSFEMDGYRTKDVTVFAPHILRDHGGAVQATLLRKPDTVAVYALADGQVALCTYNSQHEVNAWHRWTTDGKVTSVCAMADGVRSDRLFLVVERNEGVNIEVVDEESDYVDNGERDFTSELVTSALNNPLESPVRKEPKRPVVVKFGDLCKRDFLEISVEGTPWTQIAKEAPWLPIGWNELLPENAWKYENTVGLRFHGNENCEILALQG